MASTSRPQPQTQDVTVQQANRCRQYLRIPSVPITAPTDCFRDCQAVALVPVAGVRQQVRRRMTQGNAGVAEVTLRGAVSFRRASVTAMLRKAGVDLIDMSCRNRP